jgi:hypothetical protein
LDNDLKPFPSVTTRQQRCTATENGLQLARDNDDLNDDDKDNDNKTRKMEMVLDCFMTQEAVQHLPLKALCTWEPLTLQGPGFLLHWRFSREVLQFCPQNPVIGFWSTEGIP